MGSTPLTFDNARLCELLATQALRNDMIGCYVNSMRVGVPAELNVAMGRVTKKSGLSRKSVRFALSGRGVPEPALSVAHTFACGRLRSRRGVSRAPAGVTSSPPISTNRAAPVRRGLSHPGDTITGKRPCGVPTLPEVNPMMTTRTSRQRTCISAISSSRRTAQPGRHHAPTSSAGSRHRLRRRRRPRYGRRSTTPGSPAGKASTAPTASPTRSSRRHQRHAP